MSEGPQSVADSAEAMREHWRTFAREDPRFYIASNRQEWSDADFYADGAGLAASVLEWAAPLGDERMLELGCGAGRMLVHLAKGFERADGVDIAPEMIAAAADAPLPDNVHLAVNSGLDLGDFADGSFDFVFSLMVFQHIPDPEVVAVYLSEIGRVLRPDAKAVLHFDTREVSVGRRIAMQLPDRVLPRTRRRFIRRHPLDSAWVREQLAIAGLRIADERDPDSAVHFVLCERTG